MESALGQAIQKRLVISFLYEGSFRTVEPYLLGINEQGHQALSAWQLSGGSGQGWREFLLSKLAALSIGQQTFQPVRAGYNPNDSRMARIQYRV